MMDNTQYYRLLVQRFAENRCTEEELEVFFQLVRQGELNEFLSEEMKANWIQEVPVVHLPERTRLHRFRKYAIAAAMLFLIATGGILYINKTPVNKPEKFTIVSSDKTAPVSNRATIKLEDGRVIYLDSAGSGQIAVQRNVNISKKADGTIAYTGSSPVHILNTLTNPVGSKVIDITLADGTRVWLNAGSSVTYPVAFTGKERKISMTGEVYFEVARDASKPFRVNAKDLQVDVLGTHFNVNAYDDEDVISTTLLEGSINIKTGKISDLLKPGQQAQLNKSGEYRLLKDADIEEVIAWKEGNFQFENADIHTVMRQIARWYNVDIQYEGTVTKHFVGTISREVNLSKVLDMLKQTGEIKFTVENGKVIVMP